MRSALILLQNARHRAVPHELLPLLPKHPQREGRVCNWDGQNRIARVFGRLPGLSSEQLNFPTLQNTIGNKVRLGRAIKALGFQHEEHAHVVFYEVVPLRVA